VVTRRERENRSVPICPQAVSALGRRGTWPSGSTQAGNVAKPPGDVERILASKGITVLDDSSPRMLLVEAGQVELKALVDSMPGWIMTPEQTISLPDPRPKLRSNRGKRKQDI
jgi:hypothetical protein